MYRSRVIPVLLISDEGLVKTKKFKDPIYVGDAVNAVKIFNEKEVDELVILDIDATKNNREPNFGLIEEIAGECFMPLCYGGGISTFDQAKRLFSIGIEKVALNSNLLKSKLVEEIASVYGAQAVVASIDVKKGFLGGYTCMSHAGKIDFKMTPVELAKLAESKGVGEVFLNSIDNDGMMAGFDNKLVSDVSKSVSVPVVAIGGAGNLDHFSQALKSGASAVAAGSMFVFHGKHRAVLISYPSQGELKGLGL